MRKILSITGTLLLVLFLLAGCVGNPKVDYEETALGNKWSANYSSFNGTEERTVTLDAGEKISADISTEGGSIAIAFEDEDGEKPFFGNGTFDDPFSFTVPTAGRYTITVTGQNHKGGFSFEW